MRCLPVTLLAIAGCASQHTTFEAAMQQVAKGWSTNDARLAADAFTEDAVYNEPPEKQLYTGRAALFDFFGGNSGRKDPMRMTFHHLAWDETSGVGFGEFTFEYKGEYSHGVVVVQMSAGKIARWREYYYESKTEDWAAFTRKNPF